MRQSRATKSSVGNPKTTKGNASHQKVLEAHTRRQRKTTKGNQGNTKHESKTPEGKRMAAEK